MGQRREAAQRLLDQHERSKGRGKQPAKKTFEQIVTKEADQLEQQLEDLRALPLSDSTQN